MCFAREGKWACFHTSPQCAHPLPQPCEAKAWARRAFHVLVSVSVAEHLGSNQTMLVGQVNAAMPDDVGHSFAYRPGERRIYGRWEHLLDEVDLSLDPRSGEELPRSFQFAPEIR